MNKPPSIVGAVGAGGAKFVRSVGHGDDAGVCGAIALAQSEVQGMRKTGPQRAS